MEEVAQPPQWMLQLENKLKRQHRLAHEIGAGSPCIKCGDACPGLDLHFWRKLCRNCKCKREDHDVADDAGYLQFEILLCSNDSSNKATRKKPVLDLKMPVPSDNKKPEEKTQTVTLDWVPPGITLDLAKEYLQKLPAAKLPITGSAGALYRRQQFERQLPAHDLAPGLCHQLTQQEVDELNKYLSNLKNSVVGQGKVEKLHIVPHPAVFSTSLANTAAKFSQHLKKPPHHTDLRNLNSSPKPFVSYDRSLLSRPDADSVSAELLSNTSPIKLKTPSSFVPYNSNAKKYLGNNLINNNKDYKQEGSTSPGVIRRLGGDSENDLTRLNNNSAITGECEQSPNRTLPTSDTHLPLYKGVFSPVKPPLQYVQHSESQSAKGPQCIAKPLSTWPKGNAPLSDRFSNLEIGSDPANNYVDNFNRKTPDSVMLSSGVQPAAFADYGDMDSNLEIGTDPSNNYLDNFNRKTPDSRTLSSGVEPPGFVEYGDNDSDSLIDTEIEGYGQPVSTKPLYCQDCKIEIYQGEVVVSAERAGSAAYWHPQCFVCTTCKELLVDLVYFFHEDKVYCGRHYAATVNMLRCFACDELIFVNQYTMAEGKNFHIRHFCCFHCDTPLAGKEYIPTDGHPVCLDCFRTKHSKVCLTCEKIIEPTDKRVSVNDLHWHAVDECFRCQRCKKPLFNSKMVIDSKKPYCNKQCVLG